MRVLFVVNREEEWPFDVPGTQVARAREYLTSPTYTNGVCDRVVNLCRFDRYQGRGYYVSLLAEARGHKPLPDVSAIDELQDDALLARLSEKIEALAQGALQQAESGVFELFSYFGVDPAGRHTALAREVFSLVRVPLLRAVFEKDPGARWKVKALEAVNVSDVPPQHREALMSAAAGFSFGNALPATLRRDRRPAIAILHNEDAVEPPSNPKALEHFLEAARSLGMHAELLRKHEIERLPEFDALFMRDTTHIGHYTYQFARSAADTGLVVIDDPDSIVQCNNKVYLNELLARHHVPTPRTVMVHPDNVGEVVEALRLPCILKQPDSEFSLGVNKIETEAALHEHARRLFERSELLIAQEWLPTTFDWRVAILDRRPFFVCKYYMAPGHWQVIKRDSSARVEGRTTAYAVGEAPQSVVQAAWKAANLIGDGLYGVDVKEVNGQAYVIEVNDNPNVDAGNEDQVLGPALYREVMGVFLRRIRERRHAHAA